MLSDFWRNCLFSKSIVTCFFTLGDKKDDIKAETVNTKSLEIKSKKQRKKNPNPVYPIKDKISNKLDSYPIYLKAIGNTGKKVKIDIKAIVAILYYPIKKALTKYKNKIK